MTFKRKIKSKTTKTEVQKMGKIKHKKTKIDGIVFHSKMESRYYELLKSQLENGEIKSFKLQPEFILQEKFIIVDGKTILGSDPDFNKIKRQTKAPTIQAIKYISDFEVEHLDGRIEIIDTKGQETADFKIKKKMFMYKYPHLELKVIIEDKNDGWIDYDTYKKKVREQKKNKISKRGIT